MKKSIVYLLFLSAIYVGCSDHNSHNQESKEHEHNEQTSAIELNNGEKWKVNVEMTVPINEMEMLINDFTKTEQEDYIVLAKDLQDQINALVSSCTMTGKSHDELHKWLLPYMELVNELAETKNETDAEMVFEKIKASMSTYNEFFQS